MMWAERASNYRMEVLLPSMSHAQESPLLLTEVITLASLYTAILSRINSLRVGFGLLDRVMVLWHPSSFRSLKHLALEDDTKTAQFSKEVSNWVSNIYLRELACLELCLIHLRIDIILSACNLTELSLHSVVYTASDFRWIFSLLSHLHTFVLHMKIPPLSAPRYDLTLGPATSTTVTTFKCSLDMHSMAGGLMGLFNFPALQHLYVKGCKNVGELLAALGKNYNVQGLISASFFAIRDDSHANLGRILACVESVERLLIYNCPVTTGTLAFKMLGYNARVYHG